MMEDKQKIAAGLFALVLVFLVFWFSWPPHDPPAPEDYRTVAKHVDDFNEGLAQIAKRRLGSVGDVTIAAMKLQDVPIGTLLRPGLTWAVDDESCVTAVGPASYPEHSLFPPSYELDGGVAASMGIDGGVVAGLAEAGAEVDQRKKVKLSFKRVSQASLTDQQFRRVLATEKCQAALADGPYPIVRGYFTGQRYFQLSTTRKASIRAGVDTIGVFKLDPGSESSTVTLADDQPVHFLVVLSQAARSGDPPISPASPAPVSSPTGAGRVYLQRDLADASGNIARVALALKAKGFPVIPQIQPLSSARMPALAEVRYFNEGDINYAHEALGALLSIYPDARLVRVMLASPSRQLEIWAPGQCVKSVNLATLGWRSGHKTNFCRARGFDGVTNLAGGGNDYHKNGGGWCYTGNAAVCQIGLAGRQP